jgi:CheY-like chemotaxis protein
MLLELNQCEVRSAYDGPAALEIAEVFRPDVVLLDLCLPHMSGYEIASALRRLAERQEAMRIVAISGISRKQDIARALAAGFDAHLTKPAEISDLLQVIQEAAPQRSTLVAEPASAR